MSADQKVEVAELLALYMPSEEESLTVKIETLNFLNFLVPTASAQVMKRINDLRVTIGLYGQIGKTATFVGGATITALGVFVMSKGGLVGTTGGGIITLSGVMITSLAVIEFIKSAGDLYKFFEKKLMVDIHSVNGANLYSAKATGIFGQIDAVRDLTHKSALIRKVVNNTKNLNEMIDKANAALNDFSNINLGFSTLNLFSKIPKIQFPKETGIGDFSPRFIKDIKLLDGLNVVMSNIQKDDEEIKFELSAGHTQNVKIKFKYINQDLGLEEDVVAEVQVRVPEPTFLIYQGNRDIKTKLEFLEGSDVSSYGHYIWTFGDDSAEVTTSIAEASHRYKVPGVYNVGFKIYDKSSRLIYEKSRIITVEDRIYFFLGGSDDLSNLTPNLVPTSYLGYKYEYVFEGDGKCYSNDIEYLPTSAGEIRPWLVYYNCSRGNLLP